MKILVTGSAGFIGYHLSKRLVDDGCKVVGIDCINDYYDVNLKYGRLKDAGFDVEQIEYNRLITNTKFENFSFAKIKLEDEANLEKLFEDQKFDVVCNLAAQVGVRYSIINPKAYVQSNMIGFSNLLEVCRQNTVKHLIYASSSSVYGMNKQLPFATTHNVDHPISFYAASKKSNELMAHSYSHLYHLPTTGLRFFTVYGPWGRPDMAIFLFTKKIINNEPINVFNHGKMARDFTYVDDIVEGIVRITKKPPAGQPKNQTDYQPNVSSAPYRVYNIGNNNAIKLLEFITEIERAVGKKAILNMMPMQPGDMTKTWADVDDLIHDYDYRPNTALNIGISRFVSWYRKFYNK